MSELEGILGSRNWGKGRGKYIYEFASDEPFRVGSKPGPVVKKIDKTESLDPYGESEEDLFGDDEDFWEDELNLSPSERRAMEREYERYSDDGAYSLPRSAEKRQHNYTEEYMNTEDQDYDDRQYGQDYGGDDLNLKSQDTRTSEDVKKQRRKAILRKLQNAGYDFNNPEDKESATAILKEAGLL